LIRAEMMKKEKAAIVKFLEAAFKPDRECFEFLNNLLALPEFEFTLTPII
jgi:hypothetical protein